MSYETIITIACVVAAAIIIRIAFRQPITAWEELMRAKLAAYPDKHYYGSLASELSEVTVSLRVRAERAEAALEESKVWQEITKERGDEWRNRYYAATGGGADTEESIKIHADKLNALDTRESGK